MAAAKRAAEDDTKDSRENCIFGVKCYRRNPVHFKEFQHPHLESLQDMPKNPGVLQDQWKIINDMGLLSKTRHDKKAKLDDAMPPVGIVNDNVTEVIEQKEVKSTQASTNAKVHPLVQKLQNAEPYSLFFTKVKDEPSTHKDQNSIFLTDLLHACHGNLKSTVQINFLVDYEWLKMSYEATGNEKIPLLILYGEENPDLHPNNLSDNVRAVRIRSPYPYGTHHTKLMILVYDDDSVRIVVSTANLVPSDWENRTQGLWISPKCPPGQGDSPTAFKSSLVRYLLSYQVSQLHTSIEAVKAADFSQVNAFFVASAPGSHQGSSLCHYGHMAVASIMRQHLKPCNWPLIMQCSSIGSLGTTPSAWAMSELAGSLAPNHRDVKVVFPSRRNVNNSIDGIAGGQCLPYRKQTHEKQSWFRDYLHQWKCDKYSRTKAVPHIKTYAQVSQDQKAAFILLTSSNLSKAAWGKLNKAGDKLHIMSYEAGILLLPKFVLKNEDFFDISLENRVILPFDFPLLPYEDSDGPFFMDYLEEYLRS